MVTRNKNEKDVRELIENWTKAVRNRDINSILAFHSEHIVMFDVPEPFQSVGLEAYRKTWEVFFQFTKPGVFDVHELHVIAGNKVAFVYGKLQCSDKTNNKDYTPLDFRLTIGLKKIKGIWTILHEHHSIPAEQGK
jgi:ketosteroid isomerase-like protein